MLNARIGFINQAFTFDPNGSSRDPLTGHEVGNDSYRWSKSYIKQNGSATNWSGSVKQMDAQLEGNLFVEKLLGGDHELRFGVEYNTADNVSNTIYPNQRMLAGSYYGDFSTSRTASGWFPTTKSTSLSSASRGTYRTRRLSRN